MITSKIMLAVVGVLVVGSIGMAIANHQPSPKNMTMNAKSSVAQSPEVNQVLIQNYTFNPTPMTVKVGTTVTWKNLDIAKHTITVDGSTADGPKSELFGKDQTYSYTFNTAGTYKYHCEPHPYMKGEVMVVAQ